MISDHETQWLGLPVEVFDTTRAEQGKIDYRGKIYRLTLDWDSEIGFAELFSKFVATPACADARGIIIGAFHGDDSGHDTSEVVQLLVAARNQLTSLKGIFLADLTSEENEISWINQSDVSPLFAAYPALEHLRLRGAQGLSLGGNIRHENLKSLILESGGLPATILREIASCDFPALEKLELWLGSSGYGGDTTVADLRPFLEGDRFPRLKELGLRNSEYTDEIAAALANAPILQQLHTLDLSMGTLGDEGASALLANPVLGRLQKIDFHHHFMSNGKMAEVLRKFPQANVSVQEESDEDHRYCAVSE